MFAKLLKYEWRSCRQVLGVLCIITLASGLTMGLSGVYLTWDEARKSTVLAMFLLSLAALVIGICAAGGFFYLIWRFYQSRFTDEGYLTFTLPVGGHQQLLSALVNIFRGSALVLLATLGAFTIMGICYLLFFFPKDADWGALFQAVQEYLPRLLEGLNWLGLLEVLFFVLVTTVSQVIVILFSITVGAVWAKKHKILAAVAVYYGITTLLSWGQIVYGFGSENLSPWCYGLLANLITAVAGYFGMYWLTGKKLNLT